VQVELLNPGEPTKQYAVIFYQGDEAFSGLLDASGEVLSSFGHPGHQLGHTLAVDSKGNIYVAETDWGRRIQNFKPIKCWC